MAKKENTFEEICRDIVAKKFQPVYILMGEEPFFMDRITDLLIENVLAESERDFNQMIMYGADTDYKCSPPVSDDVGISVGGCAGSPVGP